MASGFFAVLDDISHAATQTVVVLFAVKRRQDIFAKDVFAVFGGQPRVGVDAIVEIDIMPPFRNYNQHIVKATAIEFPLAHHARRAVEFSGMRLLAVLNDHNDLGSGLRKIILRNPFEVFDFVSRQKVTVIVDETVAFWEIAVRVVGRWFAYRWRRFAAGNNRK